MANTIQRDNDDFEEFRRQRARDAGAKRFADMSDDDWRSFYVSMDKYEAVELAKSPYCPVDAYRILLDYPSDDVHEALARKRGPIARFLSQELQRYKNPEVWRGIAENPDADPTILGALLKQDKDFLTCELAAWNPSTPQRLADEYFYEKNSNKAWGIE